MSKDFCVLVIGKCNRILASAADN